MLKNINKQAKNLKAVSPHKNPHKKPCRIPTKIQHIQFSINCQQIGIYPQKTFKVSTQFVRKGFVFHPGLTFSLPLLTLSSVQCGKKGKGLSFSSTYAGLAVGKGCSNKNTEFLSQWQARASGVPLLSALHHPHKHTSVQASPPIFMLARKRKGRKEKWERVQKRKKEKGVGRVSKEVVSFYRVLGKVKVCRVSLESRAPPSSPGLAFSISSRSKALCGQEGTERRKALDRSWRVTILGFPAPSTPHIKVTILEIL